MPISDDIKEALSSMHCESLKNRFTRLQNRVLDQMPKNLRGCDHSVIDAVIRKTNGYNYASCRLSFSDLADISGHKIRNIKNAVKRLREIGILCVLPKEKKTATNEYYIDPYWNTEKSIRKQLEAIYEQEKNDISGPCLLEEFSEENNIEQEMETEILHNEQIEDHSEQQSEITDIKNAEPINKPTDSETDQSENKINAKEFVKGLISSMRDDSTRHLCSDQFCTSALNSNDLDPCIGLKKQTYTTDEKKNVCYKISLETGIGNSLLNRYIEKYGLEYLTDMLEIIEDFKHDNPLSNPAGYFTMALKQNYQPSKRLRLKRENQKRISMQEYENSQKLIEQEKIELAEAANAMIISEKRSKLSDCEYRDFREKAKQMLIEQGAKSYFILDNAIESQINMLLLAD